MKKYKKLTFFTYFLYDRFIQYAVHINVVMKMGIYLLAAAGTLMALGDIALAAWSKEGQMHLIAAGLLLNIIGIIAYACTLGVGSVGAATAVMLGLNILMVAIFGYLFFGQALGAARALAMIMLVASIFFIEVLG